MGSRHGITRLAAGALLSASLVSTAAEVDAPPEAAACTACHGANGISVSDEIPNLAAQKGEYLASQLTAFRAGERKNPLMNAIASQLDDAEIETLVSYFSGLPAADEKLASATEDLLTGAEVPFPEDWETSFTRYAIKNRPDNNQRREFFANEAALESMRDGAPLADNAYLLVAIYKAKMADGEPVTGADGYYEADALVAFTAMERQPGWGEQVPAYLRNSDWNYAAFSKEGELNAGVNQAGCMACHKPLDDVDYMFMHDDLAAAVAK